MTNPGRPTLYGTRMRRVQVMLDEGTVARARELGNGNLSKGVRACVAYAWSIGDAHIPQYDPTEKPNEPVPD